MAALCTLKVSTAWIWLILLCAEGDEFAISGSRVLIGL